MLKIKDKKDINQNSKANTHARFNIKRSDSLTVLKEESETDDIKESKLEYFTKKADSSKSRLSELQAKKDPIKNIKVQSEAKFRKYNSNYKVAKLQKNEPNTQVSSPKSKSGKRNFGNETYDAQAVGHKVQHDKRLEAIILSRNSS